MALYRHVRLSLLAGTVHMRVLELHPSRVVDSVESPDGPVHGPSCPARSPPISEVLEHYKEKYQMSKPIDVLFERGANAATRPEAVARVVYNRTRRRPMILPVVIEV